MFLSQIHMLNEIFYLLPHFSQIYIRYIQIKFKTDSDAKETSSFSAALLVVVVVVVVVAVPAVVVEVLELDDPELDD